MLIFATLVFIIRYFDMKQSLFQLFFSLIIAASCFTSHSLGQQKFSGEIVYHVQMIDTNVQKIIDDREMRVSTNDTLSRIVTQIDALGEQVTIKHFVFQKSYLLINMLDKKLAIQTDYSDDSSKVDPYEINYRFFGRKKVNGFVLKKASVYRKDLIEPRTIWYFKDIRPDLLDIYPGIKGLPAEFYLGTVDGLVHYSVKSAVSKPIDKDVFGIPSDYEKITLSDFMKHVRGEGN